MKTLITQRPYCPKTLTAAEAIEKWCTRCAKPVERREEAA